MWEGIGWSGMPGGRPTQGRVGGWGWRLRGVTCSLVVIGREVCMYLCLKQMGMFALLLHVEVCGVEIGLG